MTMIPSAAVTSLDVLENFFGDVPTTDQILALSDTDLDELHDRVMEFSSAKETELVPENSIYPGSWIAGNWHLDVMRPDLNQCLIYQDSIVTHDPVADFFGMSVRWLPEFRDIRAADGSMILQRDPKMWTQNHCYESLRSAPDRARYFLASLIPYVFELAPMIKSRVIVPRPQWKTFKKRRNEMLTSTRHDVKNPLMTDGAPRISQEVGPIALWDQLHGMRAELTKPMKPSDQRWNWETESFHLAKQVAFSDQFSTVYVPHYTGDLELLKLKIDTLSRVQQNQPSSSVLEELSRVVLPDLNLSARTAVSIRKDDESFEAWRRAIRTIDRDAAADDPNALRQRIEDELATVKGQIDREAFGPALKQYASRGGLGAAFTAVSQAGVDFVTGGEVNLVAAAATGAVGWIAGMFLLPQARGAGRVMVSLQRSEPIPSAINRRRGLEPQQ